MVNNCFSWLPARAVTVSHLKHHGRAAHRQRRVQIPPSYASSSFLRPQYDHTPSDDRCHGPEDMLLLFLLYAQTLLPVEKHGPLKSQYRRSLPHGLHRQTLGLISPGNLLQSCRQDMRSEEMIVHPSIGQYCDTYDYTPGFEHHRTSKRGPQSTAGYSPVWHTNLPLFATVLSMSGPYWFVFPISVSLFFSFWLSVDLTFSSTLFIGVVSSVSFTFDATILEAACFFLALLSGLPVLI